MAIVGVHGTEFPSLASAKWAYRRKTELRFLKPGKPIENAFIESLNAIFWHDGLCQSEDST